MDKCGLEPTECTKSALEEVASVVRKGINALSNMFGMPEIHQGSDLKLACLKIDVSGKKF